MMISSSAGGISGTYSLMGSGRAERCRRASSSAVAAVKGGVPESNFVEDNAERIDVGSGGGRFARGLFGREVKRRAPDDVVAFAGFDGGEGARDAKVGDLEAHILRDEHVVRLDIAVDETGAVGVPHAGAGLDHERDAILHTEKRPRVADELFQIFAGDVLHDDVEQVIGEAEIVHGDDIGMRKVRGGSRLEPELVLELFVVGIFLAQDFDRDGRSKTTSRAR
jgi:hypothetical protein